MANVDIVWVLESFYDLSVAKYQFRPQLAYEKPQNTSRSFHSKSCSSLAQIDSPLSTSAYCCAALRFRVPAQTARIG